MSPSDYRPNYIRAMVIFVAWIAGAVGTFGLAIYGAEAKIAPSSAWILALPLVIALLTSVIFWMLPMPDDSRSVRLTTGHAPEKAKRGDADQLAVLLSLMDEDELAAFKARLQDRVINDLADPGDGELPDEATLEALLTDDRDVLQG